MLGQIDSPGASRALAMLAILSPSPEVRQIATQTLRRRDPREFAPLLIAMLRDPVKYEVKKVNGPGSPGELLIKQQRCERQAHLLTARPSQCTVVAYRFRHHR